MELTSCVLGLSIEEHELIDLTEKAYGSQWQGVYPSAGGCGKLRIIIRKKGVLCNGRPTTLSIHR